MKVTLCGWSNVFLWILLSILPAVASNSLLNVKSFCMSCWMQKKYFHDCKYSLKTTGLSSGKDHMSLSGSKFWRPFSLTEMFPVRFTFCWRSISHFSEQEIFLSVHWMFSGEKQFFSSTNTRFLWGWPEKTFCFPGDHGGQDDTKLGSPNNLVNLYFFCTSASTIDACCPAELERAFLGWLMPTVLIFSELFPEQTSSEDQTRNPPPMGWKTFWFFFCSAFYLAVL